MPKIEITSNKGLVQSAGSTGLGLTLDANNTVERIAIVENATAFVRNSRSNAQWPQPANTFITGISLLFTAAPVTAASANLGYVVGTAAAGAQIAAAVADELIDAGADGTDLAQGGIARATLERTTTSDTTLAADPSFTTTARTLYLNTQDAQNKAVTTSGEMRWVIEYLCFE